MQAKTSNFVPDPNTLYKIVPVQNGNLVFTAPPGTILRICTSTGAESQAFHIQQHPNSNCKYTFSTPNKLFFLRVEGDSPEDNSNIFFKEGISVSSYFDIKPVTTGNWSGRAWHISTFSPINYKVLDVRGGYTNNGDEIIQYFFHGEPNQNFAILPVPGPGEVDEQFIPSPHAEYQIVSLMNDKKALTVAEGQCRVTISDYVNGANQKFKVQVKDGQAKFVVNSTGGILGVECASNQQFANIVAVKDQNASSWFKIRRNKHEAYAKKGYILRTFAFNMGVNLADHSTQNGNKIIQYGVNHGENQIWLIRQVSPQ